MKKVLMLSVLSLFLVSISAQAETTVTLSNMHMCCGGCEKAIKKAVSAAGAQVRADRKAGIAILTATDDQIIASALKQLSASGYSGKSDHATLKIEDKSGAYDKQVTDLKVSGAHLCCGGCVKGVNQALKGIQGIEGTDAKKKIKSFTIQGTFNAKAALKALFDAGYYVSVK